MPQFLVCSDICPTIFEPSIDLGIKHFINHRYIYFHTYNWFITYILLNVLIGVVIDNFSTFYLSANDPIMSEADIGIFQGGWNVVDIDRCGFVSVRKARFCLRLIYERLKLDKPLMLDRCFLEIEKNQLNRTNRITFHKLLFIIAYKKIPDMSKSLQMDERHAREEIDKSVLEEVAMTTIKSWAAKIIKRRRASSETQGKSNLEKRLSGRQFNDFRLYLSG